MARTELPNGVILPAEYSDDWYEDMTSNLTKLDDVIGSDAEKLNADGVDFLRMSSAALTDGGTGNFSDLNSSYKIKTGDLILDSGRKLYQIVSVNSTTETFTVGNLLFKVTAESDLAPVAESGDYDDLDNKPDLNPYDQHIADTDIHVTTADKNKWNNQSYVFRYSSTALTPSSTNSNTLLDNTDNLKVGDKVIDSSGVLFSITAIDTANSTFTIGTALIDLAQDSDVVHKSGDETIAGFKTFSSTIRLTASPNIRMYLSDDEWNVQPTTNKQSEIRFTDKNSVTMSYFAFQHRPNSTEPFRTCWRQQKMDGTSGYYSIAFGNLGNFYPENDITITLGTQSSRWKSVYATNYYYGSNNVEFSTKFVTTDTNQTVSGVKSFINYFLGKDLSGQTVDLNDCVDAYSGAIHYYYAVSNYTNISNKPENKPFILESKTVRYVSSVDYIYYQKFYTADYNAPPSIYTRYYRSGSASWSNWIKDTDKFVTTDTNQTISGNKTFSSINGVEPSSLSLPVFPSSSSSIDISSYITDMTGSANSYTPPANGYITFVASGSQVQIFSDYGLQSKFSIQSGSTIRGYHPVLKNEAIKIYMIGTSIESFRFIPCQGNV